MAWLTVLLVAALAVGMGAFFGAPYLPTHRRSVLLALKLLDLRPGERLLELGAGDGRLMKAAAELDWRVVGYELNPVWWLVSWLRTIQFGPQVNIRLTNYLRATWPEDAKAIYVFSSAGAMQRLARKLADWPTSIRVVSYGFALPGHRPTHKTGAFYLYELKGKR